MAWKSDQSFVNKLSAGGTFTRLHLWPVGYLPMKPASPHRTVKVNHHAQHDSNFKPGENRKRSQTTSAKQQHDTEQNFSREQG